MKLIQLNLWGGKLGTSLKRYFEQEQPDMVCLQEACDISKRPGSVIDPFRYFLPNETFPHAVFSPTFSMRYMHELLNLGNAIVSKQPLQKSETIFTSGVFTTDIDSLTDDYNIRNFIHTEAQTDSGLVHVITHHGHHDPNSKDGSLENTRQIRILADYIKNLQGPLIVTGDFNLHPKSESLEPLNTRLTNLAIEYDIKTTRTEFAKRQEVIDFIFVSDEVKVKSFQASDSLVSDHKALILDFEV